MAQWGLCAPHRYRLECKSWLRHSQQRLRGAESGAKLGVFRPWQRNQPALPLLAMARPSSMAPAPNGSGGAKYVLALLVVAALGVGVFFALRPPPAAPPAVAKVDPPKVERSTALASDALEIPEPAVVDAGVPQAPAPTTGKRKGVRRVSDSWECQGDVPAADIRRILSDSQTQVRSCYEKQLRNNNMLQGTVNLQVRIGNDGRVASTRTGGSLQDPSVKACIQGVAKNWSFPAPTGGACAVFDAPYNFTPKH